MKASIRAVIAVAILAIVGFRFLPRDRHLAVAPTHDGRIAAEKTTTVPAPPIVDHRHLASPGTLFLLQRQSVTTGSGVTGFPPGTKVHLLKDSGDTMIVSADTAQLTVPSDAVTNDVDLGALAARRDAQSQAELARVLAREAAEARADEAKQNQELAKHVEQMEQNRGVVGVGHSTKLDREAYHEKVNVTHRPHIYYWPYRP